MKTIMRSTGQTLSILVALVFTPGIGLTTVFAHDTPKEIIGFGEGKAITSIETNMLKGGIKAQESSSDKSLGAIGDVVGNRFTFAFAATKGAEGKVVGQLFLTDHKLNLTVSTEIAKLEPHPKRSDVVGVKADLSPELGPVQLREIHPIRPPVLRTGQATNSPVNCHSDRLGCQVPIHSITHQAN
jgi:hypothetical protein